MVKAYDYVTGENPLYPGSASKQRKLAEAVKRDFIRVINAGKNKVHYQITPKGIEQWNLEKGKK